uniref:Uncharacterized protein n=1 Tax=Anopheles maculatus TaxID=74869 RepID=A0A182SUN4_9DIPT
MNHDDRTDEQSTNQRMEHQMATEDRAVEREEVVVTNATPSCLPQLPVAVEGSPQSEGNTSHRGEQTVQTPWGYFPVRHRNANTKNVTPEIVRLIPNSTPAYTQHRHTQPKGSGRVDDGASSSAMANTHRSMTSGRFMILEQELGRKRLDLDRLKVELQRRELELRERELEFLHEESVNAREPRTEPGNASAYLRVLKMVFVTPRIGATEATTECRTTVT